MKNLSLLAVITFFSICLMGMDGCGGGMCKGVDCGNGICDEVDGKCICNQGLTIGADSKCSQEIRAKYIGEWQGIDSCSATTPTYYIISIVKDSANISSLYIHNLIHAPCDSLPLIISAESRESNVLLNKINCSKFHNFTGTALAIRQDSTLKITYQYTDEKGNLQECKQYFEKK